MKLNFKKFSIWIILTVILILILLVLTFSNQGFYDYYLHKNKLKELEARIDSLRRVNDSLFIEIELLKKDSNKIEQIAREKYGLIKPGEKIYKIKITK